MGYNAQGYGLRALQVRRRDDSGDGVGSRRDGGGI